MNESEEFGEYRLVRPLGSGGMAMTSLAVRRGEGGFEQEVCLKRILPHLAEDADFVEGFLEEARLSARLRHGHLASVVDFGVVKGTHFIALEYVEGRDLRGVLRAHGTLDADLVARIACDIASGLAHAHARGVIHRDLSPSNILVSDAGEVKLTDFGIAHVLGRTRMTRAGYVKGKVAYMAPEYAATGAFDARADLFSLGVTLFECATGTRPYVGDSDVEVLAHARDGKRVDTPLDLPLALADAILACIEPNPSERPESADALLRRLEFAAPSPTARRSLGALARSEEAPTSDGTGTARVEVAAPAMPKVLSASPDAETRIRPAAGDGPTSRAPQKFDAPDKTVPSARIETEPHIQSELRARDAPRPTPRWLAPLALCVLVLAVAGFVYVLSR